jgi:glucose-1-phosphate cytidylyltransferase
LKVVILCGGFGTRLHQETEIRPKPMVEIGGRPILWHIMKTFAHYGHKEFVLCLGYKGESIKNYFLNYNEINNDFTIDLSNGNLDIHDNRDDTDWKITLVNTGLNTMTGARVKRVEQFVDGDLFMLTYGDGVTDIDINKLIEFHKSQNKIGTVTGVSPPSRYGELAIAEDKVVSFREKPQSNESFISGGYFVFRPEFFKYLREDEDCVLEQDPLERLAADGELAVYAYKGFWQCMDTYRDFLYLNELWDQGQAKWQVWQ